MAKEETVEHTLLLVELPPAGPGSARILREEVNLNHPAVESVTVHIRLKKALGEDSDLGLQLRVGPVDSLEAPRPERTPQAVPKNNERIRARIIDLESHSLYGHATLAVGANDQVFRGMRALIASVVDEEMPGEEYATGYVTAVGPTWCKITYTQSKVDGIPRKRVVLGDSVFLFKHYGADVVED